MTVPIAIVGVGAHFPGSNDATGFWRDIVTGRDLLRDIPASHWLIEDYYDPDPRARDKTYARRAAVLDPVTFDALEWGMPPAVAEATDTTQLLTLMVARQVLDDASHTDAEIDRSRVAVILGVSSAQELAGCLQARLERPVWVKAMREEGLPEDRVQAICDRIVSHYPEWQEASFPGLLGNVIAGRVTNRLDLGGTNCSVDAACASSFAAISMAATELELGKADMVLSGGVDTLTDILTFMCFSKTPAMSPTGEARPFSDRADGTMLGEGLGIFALKRLADAEAAGDRIYAVLRGIGSSSDGRAKSIYAPTPKGQALALHRAYAEAGYTPDTVGLVEAHGTGTLAGDAAELAALREVFAGTSQPKRPWCALGSVKSQIGHTKGAAGAAGMFKAVMALYHGVLPPTLHVERPNPKLDLEHSPFYLSQHSRPWIRPAEYPRRAAVSAFGFGGSNFHVTLEAWEGSVRERLPMGAQLIVLCGETGEALASTAREAAELAKQPEGLAWLAQQDSYDPAAPARLAIAATDGAEACTRLLAAADRLEKAPREAFVLPDGTAFGFGTVESGHLALLFPGQGSQYVEMGAELAMQFDCVRQVWEKVSALHLGDRPLAEVVFPIPGYASDQDEQDAARLRDTRWTQPAIAACSAALLPLLRRIGLQPKHFAGHSLGELSALYAAGCFDAVQLVELARTRAEAMSEAAQGKDGAMLAVKASAERIEAALGRHELTLANYNHPEQIVLSGLREGVVEAEQKLRAAGIDSRLLPTGGAFHSQLVAPAVETLAVYLQDMALSRPVGTVWSNNGNGSWPQEPEQVAALLAQQLAKPVQFTATIEAMYASGIRTFVEVGPGAVLTGLVGPILGERPHRAIALDRPGKGSQALLAGLALLVADGVPFAPHRLTDEHRRARDPKTRSAPALPLTIAGCNYAKQYPPPEGAAGLPAPNPPRSQAETTKADKLKAPAVETKPAEVPSFQTPTPKPAVPSPAVPGVDPAWLEVQRLTAEGHAAFQEALSQSFSDFMRVMEASLQQHPQVSSQVLSTPPPFQPTVVAPTPPIPEVTTFSPEETPPSPKPAPQPAPSVEAEEVAKPVEAAPVDIEAMLLEVVAERTGYPAELVNLDMDIEGDLGIDSIKKVEILAEAQERIPNLSNLNVERIGRLRTLREVLEHLQELLDPNAAKDSMMETAEPTVNSDAVAASWSRAVLDTSPLPLPNSSLPGLLDQTLWLIGDEDQTKAALAAALQARGVDAQAGDRLPADARAVLFLGGLQENAEPVVILEQALSAAQVLAANGSGLWIGVGLDTVSATAGLDGLARTLRREYPEIITRTIALDVQATANLGELLARELLEGGDASWVYWQNNLRSGRLLRQQAVEAPQPVLQAGDVVVVSGGARGVTAACIQTWAQEGVRLVLLGTSPQLEVPESLAQFEDEAALIGVLARSPDMNERDPRALRQQAQPILRSREIQHTLDSIQAVGGQASYRVCDVTDHSAVRACLEQVHQELGPIRGLVHAAGVLADRPLLELQLEELRRVVRVKLDGLENLLAATELDELRLVVGFGSVSGVFGNTGQAAYAAANAAMANRLERLAQQQPELRVACLAWGPWDGGMVAPALAQLYRNRGVELIPLSVGAEAFLAELQSDGATTRVLVWGSLEALAPDTEALQSEVAI